MNEQRLNELWIIFKEYGAEALAMNHYDLAEATGIDSEEWKVFLTTPEVERWITTEIKLIQESELKKMIQTASKSRSVGQSQLMNTLAKLGEDRSTKEGPIFIYTYVPLNAEQEQASNVVKLDKDPFLKGDL